MITEASYQILCTTGTHADVFAAVGTAGLLHGVQDRVRIRKHGAVFELSGTGEIRWEELERNLGFRYIKDNEKAVIPTEFANANRHLDYAAEKAKKEQAKVAAKQKLEGEAGEIANAIQPDPMFQQYQCLIVLQGDGATNKAQVWLEAKTNDEWRKIAQDGLSGQGDRQELGPDSDLVQVFNPQAAKGYARLKPDGTSRNDKTKESWSDPWQEMMKYRGFFEATVIYLLGSKGENVRILTPLPGDVSFDVYTSIVRELRAGARSIFGNGVKVDVLTALRVGILVIKRTPLGEGKRSRNTIEGLTVTHYQSMGQAKSVTNMERLGLPDWYPVNTEEEQTRWTQITQEHFDRLQRLDAAISDQLALLQQYRKYLQTRGEDSINELVTFLREYGILLMRERGQGTWMKKQFEEQHIEEIIMHTSLRGILENPGFQAVAEAIRKSTVSAQALKKNKQDYREIRYDLLPEIRRKIGLGKSGKLELVSVLSEFVATYNAESARRFEMDKKNGKSRVDENDFLEFIGLFDGDADAGLIANLLCAYATCKAKKIEDGVDQ